MSFPLSPRTTENIPPQHPFTLKFLDPNLEQFYREQVYANNLLQIRVVFALFAIVYSLLGLVDKFLEVTPLSVFLTIRLGIVLPLFVMILILSFTKFFFRWNQILILIAFIIGGIGVDIMLILEPENLTYYAGLFMIFFSGFFIVRLDFYLATIGGVVVFLFFTIGMAVFNDQFDIQLVSTAVFYLFSLFIGIAGSYFIDLYRRKYIILNRQIIIDNEDLVGRVQAQVVEITQAQNATILALAKLAESRDTDTGEHVARVGAYCRIVAQGLDRGADAQMGMPRHRFIDIISSASLLHDIGKVGIEDQILNKPVTLNHEEFEQIKSHTIIGYQTLQVVRRQNPENQFIQMGLEIVRSHHEWWNGAGYPDGLSGTDIPLAARVMAVVDAYDAIRERRPYKEPVRHEVAVKEILKASGTHFDPMIVLAFLQKSNELEELSKQHFAKSLNIL